MNRKSTLYIAYGSNLNLPQMANRCPTAEVVGQVRQLNVSWHFGYKKGEYCGKSKKHSFFL